jgi:polyketide biosynthesis acyl carrier protein
MTYDEVLETVRQNITTVLPSVSASAIRPEMTLKELGADSVDRADISTMSMEALGLRLPLVELGKAGRIEDLIQLFLAHGPR